MEPEGFSVGRFTFKPFQDVVLKGCRFIDGVLVDGAIETREWSEEEVDCYNQSQRRYQRLARIPIVRRWARKPAAYRAMVINTLGSDADGA